MVPAAIDRLVHHSTIFEMNVESYRRRTASDKQQTGADNHPSTITKKDRPLCLTLSTPCLQSDRSV
jgi:hypothetical protein